ncbi:MAG: hypothetical protein ABJB47_06690 [Actinomycetota bacterium]
MRKIPLRRRIAQLGGTVAMIAAVSTAAGPAWGQSGSLPPPAHQKPAAAAKASTMSAMAPGNTGSAALAGQLRSMREATAKYVTNLGAAKKAGYQIITRGMPNMGFHFLNPKIQGFSVTKPQILVYEHLAGKWQLGALEWVFPKMPATPPLPNASFGQFPAACHYADGTFVPDTNAKTCAKTAPKTHAKFTFWHPVLITMHVWIWYPNPAGLYSSTNPLIAPFGRG